MTDQEWLWERGWRILSQAGNYNERAARTLLGKFIKENGAPVVARGLRRLDELKPVDPISWLQAGFAKIREKNAWKHTSGKVPKAKIPEFTGERVSPDKWAELKQMLMDGAAK